MEIIKKTITREEITGYKAFDGTWFRHEEECIKYEQSAEAAAKATAWHYIVGERHAYDLVGSDDSLIIFDIPNASAYEIVRHWAELAEVWSANDFTPEYIGKRVAFRETWDGIYFETRLATKEAAIANYIAEIEAVFADKKEPKAE